MVDEVHRLAAVALPELFEHPTVGVREEGVHVGLSLDDVALLVEHILLHREAVLLRVHLIPSK